MTAFIAWCLQYYKSHFIIPLEGRSDIARKNLSFLMFGSGVMSLFFIVVISIAVINDGIFNTPREKIFDHYGYSLIANMLTHVCCIFVKMDFDKRWKMADWLAIFCTAYYHYLSIKMMFFAMNSNRVDYIVWVIWILVSITILYIPPVIFITGLGINLIIVKQICGLHDSALYANMIILAFIAVILEFSRCSNFVQNCNQASALQIEKERADAANKTKSSFLANMSHEIRTPINAVLGMDELIIRESNEPQIVTYAENIQTAGKTLLSIINDILDFTRIESAKVNLVQDVYEFSSTINDLITLTNIKAESKGLELRLTIDPSIPHVLYGDELKLKQILTNLLSNAVKYTHKGFVMLAISWVRRSEEIAELCFMIQDSGIGIKQDNIEKLFSKFERLDEQANRSIEGTGLGLNITKSFVDLMQGALSVKSDYGVGSSFTVTIPQRIINPEPLGDFKDRFEDARLKSEAMQIVHFVAPDARILVVDDNEMNLKVAQGLLKQYKVQLVLANSGDNALRIIASGISRGIFFDMIFMDHLMPGMDGIEATVKIRGLQAGHYDTVPIVALTANAVQGVREMFLNAGMQDFVSKPIEVKKLDDCLCRWLPKSKIITDF